MSGSDKKQRRSSVARHEVPEGFIATQVRPADLASEDYYMDPKTGFMVFTASYLLNRGYCCANACRHCPYTKCEV